MYLREIQLSENKKEPLFSSAEAQQLLEAYESFYPEIGFNPPWIGYMIIDDNQLVGSCGFTGQPDNGKVELAYWTFKEFEGRGIASFACHELVSIARKENSEVTVTAKTAPELNASTRILEKNGFIYSKVVQDDEIGEAWLWVLNP